MPHITLNKVQTALGNAHGRLLAKIEEEAQRFERRVARKRGRFARERKNSTDAFFEALSESVGQKIPQNATVAPLPDGTMILSWPDPPKAPTPPADKQANEETGENMPDHDLAPVTKIPTNGQHEPAGAT